MRQPETNQDIDIQVSIAMKHLARWVFQEGRHQITINLGGQWDRAVSLVNRYRAYSILEEFPDAEKCPAYDAYIDSFVDQLNESFLVELVCIERRRQGLRMNHNRCKPCCVARSVAFMFDYTALCTRYTRFPIKAGEA
jgi:hypothetical protein